MKPKLTTFPGLVVMIVVVAACATGQPTPFPSPAHDCRAYDPSECMAVLEEAARVQPAATHFRLAGPAAPPQIHRRSWNVEVMFEDGSKAGLLCDWSEGEKVECFELELQASGPGPG